MPKSLLLLEYILIGYLCDINKLRDENNYK